MKKLVPVLFFLCLALFGYSQNALENVIVETYYISDFDDAAQSIALTGDTLPVGSVTYRIYVDMAQGYKLLNVYGSTAHPLTISTTTSFFNNSDRGAYYPSYSKTNAKSNTIMLDSWLSMGAACTGNIGVIKSSDNGVATVTNSDGILQNNDVRAGIPLTQQDGMIAGTPATFNQLGLDEQLAVFDNVNRAGNLFSSTSGSWFGLRGSSAGAIGADTTNKVLIAQITTDGTLCFALNMQVQDTAGNNDPVQYVSSSPTGSEVSFAALNFCSNTLAVSSVHKSNSSFKLYPNPASDLVNMKIESAKESTDNSYIIYGITGNVISTKKLGSITGNHSEKIDMSALAEGIYIVQLTMDGNVSYEKVIKN